MGRRRSSTQRDIRRRSWQLTGASRYYTDLTSAGARFTESLDPTGEEGTGITLRAEYSRTQLARNRSKTRDEPRNGAANKTPSATEVGPPEPRQDAPGFFEVVTVSHYDDEKLE